MLDIAHVQARQQGASQHQEAQDVGGAGSQGAVTASLRCALSAITDHTSCAGPAVLVLQRALQREGLLAAGGATGRFNSRTARAVAAWQRVRGLSPSGRLDGVALQLYTLEQVRCLGAFAGESEV